MVKTISQPSHFCKVGCLSGPLRMPEKEMALSAPLFQVKTPLNVVMKLLGPKLQLRCSEPLSPFPFVSFSPLVSMTRIRDNSRGPRGVGKVNEPMHIQCLLQSK